MKNPISADLLSRYLNGDCTPEEELFVKQWYNSFDDEDDYVSALSTVSRQHLKAKIRSRIAKDPGLSDFNTIQNRKTKPANYRILAVTAVAAALLGLGYFAVTYRPRQTTALKELPSEIRLTNTSHSLLEKTLTDGSVVWLSPGAHLTYPLRFTGSSRQVRLSGEAFFEITKNPDRPFIIYSRHVTTKVWGTSFRVRDEPDRAFADVAVVTGKVSVKAAEANQLLVDNNQTDKHHTGEVMLYPNDQATIKQNDNVIVLNKERDVRELHIWKKAKMRFEDRPMTQVTAILSKEFGVNIEAQNGVGDYLLNADFDDLNLPEIMEILKKTLNINYTVQTGKMILTKNQ